MDQKLMKVKLVFDSIKEMRSETSILFESLDGRITKLKEVYNEFIKNTNQIKTSDVKVFIFSLDSFYFQTSLLEKEYSYLIDYRNTVINRMYGEYYKLFKLIIEYVDRSHIDNKLSDILKSKKYPRYDDLDDDKEYDFNLITHLNDDIIGIVNCLIKILKDKETALQKYTTNQNYGLNVNNFVSTFTYEVNVLQEQINLYEKYLEFFYFVHQKLLKRLITKISVLEAQLNADIKFEGGLLSKKKDNKELFADMNINGLSKSAARDLRKSIVRSNEQVSPSNISSSSENDAFVPIDEMHSQRNDNVEEVTIHKSVTISEEFNGDSVASKIFMQQVEEHFSSCEDSITDEIPDYESVDDNSIEEIVEELLEEIVEKNEPVIGNTNITFDISDNNVLAHQDTLTSKQKKNLKKNIKKKEKKELVKQELQKEDEIIKEFTNKAEV